MNAGARSRLAVLNVWWAARAPRERWAAGIGGAVLGLYLLFAITIQPAWRTLANAPAQLDALDAQLQTMQRLASETKELRAMPPVGAAESAAALKAASDRLGDRAKLAIQGDRAVITLNGVGTTQLRSWLAEVRSGARARPIEANLSRAASGYNGSIIVAIGGAA